MSKNEPMDAGHPERKEGAPSVNRQRVCGAIKQLVTEVHALFPETPVDYTDYDGRNAALAAIFDASVFDAEDQSLLADLFEAVKTDVRIESVDMAEDQVFVLVRASLRTQDSRDSFGLVRAHEVLTEDEGYGGSW